MTDGYKFESGWVPLFLRPVDPTGPQCQALLPDGIFTGQRCPDRARLGADLRVNGGKVVAVGACGRSHATLIQQQLGEAWARGASSGKR